MKKEKIVVASFQYETCAFSNLLPTQADFEYFYGDDIFKKLVVKEPLEKAGFTVVPSVYANALPGGMLPRALYEKYKTQILDDAKKNKDAAAFFFYFHGSMEVEEIGSGERQLLRELREIVGKKPLIALSLDLHADITDELPELADIICGYKTAPHVDQKETQLRAVNALINRLKTDSRPASVVVPIPMLPMGDAMLTRNEPLKSLIRETFFLEKQDGIDAVNLFFGHMWIDAQNTRASVVVSADTKEKAFAVARPLAVKFWETRKDYKLTVENGNLENGVKAALSAAENRFFLSDSGDNTTAGAAGDRLDVAAEFLRFPSEKSVCIAGITSAETVAACKNIPTGQSYSLNIGGKDYDAVVTAHGKILGWAKEIIGDSVTLRVRNVDLIFTEKRSAFISAENFDCAGADLKSYRVVAVKLGYLFDELLPYCNRHYFALTDGGSCVDMKRHSYKKICRPVFPLDENAEFGRK